MDFAAQTGTCHIRSVPASQFPSRELDDFCGEWRRQLEGD